MYVLFLKGGPMMWPLLAASLIALSVVIERAAFLWRQQRNAQPALAAAMLRHVEEGRIDQAVNVGGQARDPVAATLVHGLIGREKSLANALVIGACEAIAPFQRGIGILDTIVTLAPFLGLLGTVTGMVRAFGLLGQQELDAPMAITGGIAEALIATAFGLAIAITALIPFNGLNALFEKTRHRLESAGTRFELMTRKTRTYENNRIVR